MITVYYDGLCGLCSKEITHYQRIAPADVFEWVDITKQPQALKQRGISQAKALKILHAEDQYGQLHTGVDAFILIWRQLPRWNLLARLLRIGWVKTLAKKAYMRFAKRRFQRLSHCQLAAQQEQR